MTGVESSFECCGNVAWIGRDKQLPPCPTCGKVWIGKEKVDRTGLTIIYAEEIK